MKFSHFIVFVLMVGSGLALNSYMGLIPDRALLLLLGGPIAVFGGLYLFGLMVSNDANWKGLGTTERSSGTGTFYDTAIRPSEAWHFVNQRVQELEEEGKVHPYRKINLDRSDKENLKVNQDTIKATIEGKETRITALKGRPKNQRQREMVCFVVDLAEPAIEDYSGDLETSEERENPFNGKYGFHLAEGGATEMDEKNEAGTIVNINDRKNEG